MLFLGVDSSDKIGSGHLTRCITLAEELKNRGAEILFITRNLRANYNNLIDRKRFNLIELNNNLENNNVENNKSVQLVKQENEYLNWLEVDLKADAIQTIEAIKLMNKIDLLIIDHYAIDSSWEKKLNLYCKKIIVIDDLANRSHMCDLLIDQNLFKNYKRYINKINKSTELLLGPKYSLIKNDYKKIRSQVHPRKKIKRIFIYISGADRTKLTYKVLKAFIELKFSEFEFDIVVNPYIYDEITKLIARSQEKLDIRIHKNLPNLSRLMLQADLAIGACGTTSWERCCMGLPSVVFTVAENQIGIANELHNQKYVKWIGDSRDLSYEEIKSRIF